MADEGRLELTIANSIARITFYHPKANCLTADLLKQICEAVNICAKDPQVNIVLIKSGGEGAFCAGASFDEFKNITSAKDGEMFFLGFAKLILAIRDCSKLVVVRVQGKAVGGALGLIAACDYAVAVNAATAKLSEFELGIGPFTIGPAVERKIGLAAFSAMSIDCAWREATWLAERGLYSRLYENLSTLDTELESLLGKLALASSQAGSELKRMFWAGSDGWENLLAERARASGKLLISGKKFLSN
jgi:methylglutaconyl-CoA hydratase